MNELLPCPFCGGDDVNMGVRPHFREGKGNGWTVLCADCGGSIGYIERPDGHFYAEYDTKSEAIAAWNTRAERTCDYKQAAEYWQRMYEETFAERVCHDTDENDWHFVCSACGYEQNGYEQWNYCPNCGRKVEA